MTTEPGACNRTGDHDATYVVSFPKAGRTWLRFILGQAIVRHLALESIADVEDILDVTSLRQLSPRAPMVHFTHECKPDFRRPDELPVDKDGFRQHRVILLVRDPRDIVVSHYFERTHRYALWAEVYEHDPALASVSHRLHPYTGSLSEFLREEVGSLHTIVEYYNIWASHFHVPRRFLMLRYEDLHETPVAAARSALHVLGFPTVSTAAIKAAIQACAFQRMRALESAHAISSPRLRPGNPYIPASFKVRRGRVHGFLDYLSDSDVAYASDLINRNMAPIYGYRT